MKKRALSVKDKRFKEMMKALNSVEGLYDLIAYALTFKMKELLGLIILVMVIMQLYPTIKDLVMGLIK